MAWDELTGSLDFATLRALNAADGARTEEVVRAVYRHVAAGGEDHVWIHLVPEDAAVAAATDRHTAPGSSSPGMPPWVSCRSCASAPVGAWRRSGPSRLSAIIPNTRGSRARRQRLRPLKSARAHSRLRSRAVGGGGCVRAQVRG